MTGRERILKTFKKEKVDRIPVFPWIWKNFVYEFFKIPPEEQKWGSDNEYIIEKEIEVLDYFGFDIYSRLMTPWHMFLVEKSSNDGKWIVESELKNKNGSDTLITTIRTPEKKLTQIKNFTQISKYTKVEAFLEHYIKDKDDFNQFLKYQPSFEDAVFPHYETDFNNISKAKKFIGEKGVLGVSIFGGAFNILNYFRNIDQIMMDPFIDASFYKEMIMFFSRRLIGVYKKFAEFGVDVIEYGGNLANGSVGPKFYEEFVLPFENDLNEVIHSLGIMALMHNCGDAMAIIHLYNKLEIDALGYLAPPPYGDVDFDKALGILNKNITLLGNIDQINFMMKSTPEQVKEKVKDILEKAKKRGNFILSTTDFLFDNTPYENIKAFCDAGHEYGIY
ncbi:MAG: hypothetical protein M1409_09715 [Actinobacteria bacterium]|nr:hypothetical protein [Actinomycetota bacterium]